MPSDVILEPSSSGPDQPVIPAIETWSSAQYDNWRKTGETPVAEPKPADPAPAKETPSEPAETQSESAAPESETGDQEEAQEKPKLSGAEKRIRQLVRRLHDLEAERDALQRGLQPSVEPQKPSAVPKQTAPGKPRVEEFSDYNDYNEALIDWKADQREKARIETAQRAANAERARAIDQTWEAKVITAVEHLPDFGEVLSAADYPMSDVLMEAVKTADKGAEIAYHLAKNPDECERLNSLPPVAQAREIGKLDAKFSQQSAPPPLKPTGAKKPPTELPGKAAPEDEVERALRDGDFRSYYRAENAREIKRRG